MKINELPKQTQLLLLLTAVLAAVLIAWLSGSSSSSFTPKERRQYLAAMQAVADDPSLSQEQKAETIAKMKGSFADKLRFLAFGVITEGEDKIFAPSIYFNARLFLIGDPSQLSSLEENLRKSKAEGMSYVEKLSVGSFQSSTKAYQLVVFYLGDDFVSGLASDVVAKPRLVKVDGEKHEVFEMPGYAIFAAKGARAIGKVRGFASYLSSNIAEIPMSNLSKGKYRYELVLSSSSFPKDLTLTKEFVVE